MDQTWPVIGIIIAIAVVCYGLLPLIAKSALLKPLAVLACDIAEAVIGRGNGEVKWSWALSLLAKFGLNIDSAKVQAALEAAWAALNAKQVELGMKERKIAEVDEDEAIDLGSEDGDSAE